jgi:hypothetical protein
MNFIFVGHCQSRLTAQNHSFGRSVQDITKFCEIQSKVYYEGLEHEFVLSEKATTIWLLKSELWKSFNEELRDLLSWIVDSSGLECDVNPFVGYSRREIVVEFWSVVTAVVVECYEVWVWWCSYWWSSSKLFRSAFTPKRISTTAAPIIIDDPIQLFNESNNQRKYQISVDAHTTTIMIRDYQRHNPRKDFPYLMCQSAFQIIQVQLFLKKKSIFTWILLLWCNETTKICPTSSTCSHRVEESNG